MYLSAHQSVITRVSPIPKTDIFEVFKVLLNKHILTPCPLKPTDNCSLTISLVEFQPKLQTAVFQYVSDKMTATNPPHS